MGLASKMFILFNCIIVRIRESIQFLFIGAAVIAAHVDLLHLSEVNKDRMTLILLVALAFQRPVAYKEKQ
jgi:hypothetical protein